MTKFISRKLTVAAAFGILMAPQLAAAQMDAHMRHLSTDRVQRMHHSAQMMSAHHRQAAMMRATGSNAIARQSLTGMQVGMERLGGRRGNFYVRSGEFIGINLSSASRQQLADLGYVITRSERLQQLAMTIDVIAIRSSRSVKKALRRARRADPEGTYLPNALFAASSASVRRSAAEPDATVRSGSPVVLNGTRLGLIDTAVDPRLVNRLVARDMPVTLKQRKFGPGDAVLPRRHGTTVAAQAVRSGAQHLVVADVFSNVTGYADVAAIALALEWMADQNLSVVNLSLSGPPHDLLEAAIAALIARGHVIVAAVGNEGLKRGPAYPAAYPHVIGVTAVDQQLSLYGKANAGPGVDVAAIGVDVEIPVLSSDPAESEPVSGTSFAAPVVAAILGQAFRAPALGAADLALALIERTAVDLGPPGKDNMFGAGAVFPASQSAAISTGQSR